MWSSGIILSTGLSTSLNLKKVSSYACKKWKGSQPYLLWKALIADMSFSLIYHRQAEVPLRNFLLSLYSFINVPMK